MKKSFINVNFIKKCQLGVKKKFYKLYKIEIDEKKFYKRDFYDAEVKKSFINVIFSFQSNKNGFWDSFFINYNFCVGIEQFFYKC